MPFNEALSTGTAINHIFIESHESPLWHRDCGSSLAVPACNAKTTHFCRRMTHAGSLADMIHGTDRVGFFPRTIILEGKTLRLDARACTAINNAEQLTIIPRRSRGEYSPIITEPEANTCFSIFTQVFSVIWY
jgi:hypothetical protein